MNFKYIEPEVPGGLGKEAELDNSVHPPIIKKLHIDFDGWLGDDILESFPCFLITERLKNEINFKGLTGADFDHLIVSTSFKFEELNQIRKLPKFYWMKVHGSAGVSDFGLAKDHRLVISPKVFDILSSFNIKHASFEDYLS